MKVYENGIIRELTDAETKTMQAEAEKAEKEYWTNVPYDEAVNNEIRKRYTASQEFALLRQKEEKPEEYNAYYDYCEECKAYVKSRKPVGGSSQ